MDPRYLVREGRVFRIARIGKDGLLEKTDSPTVCPLQLAHFGSEPVSITKPISSSTWAGTQKEFYQDAMKRAKEAGADFVLGTMNASTQDLYSARITFIGTIDLYLANFPLPEDK